MKPISNSVYMNKGLLELRTLKQISTEEKKDFLKTVPKETNYRQMEIIYDNRKYIERFGKDEFDKYDKETRDQQFKKSIVRQAIYDQFGEDGGLLEWLNGLTLQEQIDFLESNYQKSIDNYEYKWREKSFESAIYDIEEFTWYVVDNYSIPVPNTMYLSGDTSFNLKYKFFQNDLSKNSSIIVNCHDGDYSEMATFLNILNHHYIKEDDEIAHLREIAQFRVSFMDEAKQMSIYSHSQGRDMSNYKGPDFVDIGGQIVIHAEYDQIFKNPVTHVDTYSFYSPSKYVVVMTGYPVTEEKESKAELENVVRGIRRIK